MARSTRTAAVEQVAGLLERCADTSGVFTTLREDVALDEARRAAARRLAGRPLGPLDGVPLAVKDAFDVAGTVTTHGSLVDASAPAASRDADVVAAMRRRGVVVVGKTTMSELAFSGLGLNPHHGTPANPRSGPAPLVPGGSSSGSAVAVAAGLVPVALGTDTSGSVRVPAAFNGVVGYKASDGLLPTRGMRALAPALDSVGVLGRRVHDVRLVAAVVAPRTGRPAGPPLLVVPDDDEVVHGCDPLVAAWFAEQMRLLVDRGIPVETRRLPVLAHAQQLMDDHGTLVAAQAHERLGHLLEGPGADRLDPDVARRLRAAADVDGRVLLGRLGPLRRRLADQLGDRLLVCPTVRTPPPTVAAVRRSAAAYDALNARVLRTTMLLSYLGMPGVSLPLDDGADRGLGLLVSARHGRDGAVLDAAALVESAAG